MKRIWKKQLEKVGEEAIPQEGVASTGQCKRGWQQKQSWGVGSRQPHLNKREMKQRKVSSGPHPRPFGVTNLQAFIALAASNTALARSIGESLFTFSTWGRRPRALKRSQKASPSLTSLPKFDICNSDPDFCNWKFTHRRTTSSSDIKRRSDDFSFWRSNITNSGWLAKTWENIPFLITCHTRPRTRWGLPEINSEVPTLMTLIPTWREDKIYSQNEKRKWRNLSACVKEYLLVDPLWTLLRSSQKSTSDTFSNWFIFSFTVSFFSSKHPLTHRLSNLLSPEEGSLETLFEQKEPQNQAIRDCCVEVVVFCVDGKPWPNNHIVLKNLVDKIDKCSLFFRRRERVRDPVGHLLVFRFSSETVLANTS